MRIIGYMRLGQGARASKKRNWDFIPRQSGNRPCTLTAVPCCYQSTEENLLDFIQEVYLWGCHSEALICGRLGSGCTELQVLDGKLNF